MIGAPNKSLIESHNNNEKEIKEINNNFEIIHRRLQKQDQYSSAGQQGQEGAAWVYCGICLLTGAGQPKGQPNPDLGIQYLERAIDEFQSLDATKCLASYLSQKDAADPRALELFHQLADTYGDLPSIRHLAQFYFQQHLDHHAAPSSRGEEPSEEDGIKSKPLFKTFYYLKLAAMDHHDRVALMALAQLLLQGHFESIMLEEQSADNSLQNESEQVKTKEATRKCIEFALLCLDKASRDHHDIQAMRCAYQLLLSGNQAMQWYPELEPDHQQLKQRAMEYLNMAAQCEDEDSIRLKAQLVEMAKYEGNAPVEGVSIDYEAEDELALINLRNIEDECEDPDNEGCGDINNPIVIREWIESGNVEYAFIAIKNLLDGLSGDAEHKQIQLESIVTLAHLMVNLHQYIPCMHLLGELSGGNEEQSKLWFEMGFSKFKDRYSSVIQVSELLDEEKVGKIRENAPNYASDPSWCAGIQCGRKLTELIDMPFEILVDLCCRGDATLSLFYLTECLERKGKTLAQFIREQDDDQ